MTQKVSLCDIHSGSYLRFSKVEVNVDFIVAMECNEEVVEGSSGLY